MPQADVEKKAAAVVRRTWPTYSLVPRGIKLLRRFPLVGPFVSFPAEVVRNTANTLRLTAEELANPATHGIGAQRLAGLILAAVGISTVVAASRMLNGVSKRDEEDIRQMAPPWSENGELMVVNRDKESVRYVDLSYVDPYSVIRKPLIAFMRDQPFEESLADAVRELGKPFLGEELLAGRMIDLARNKTAEGREVYNPADAPERQAEEAFKHVADALMPGTLQSLNRVKKGLAGEVSPTGREFVPQVELAAMLTGQRVLTINYPQAVRSKGFAFQRATDNARRLFLGEAMRSGTVSNEALVDAYQRSEEARREAYTAYSRVLQAARNLGMTDREQRALLLGAGIPRTVAHDLMTGGYRPYKPGADIFKRLKQSGLRERADQWRDLSRERLLPPGAARRQPPAQRAAP